MCIRDSTQGVVFVWLACPIPQTCWFHSSNPARLGLPYPPYYGWESPKIPPVWGVVKNASGGVTPPGDSSPKWVGVRTEWGGVQEESKFSNFKWLLPGMGRSAGGSQNFKFMKTPPRNGEESCGDFQRRRRKKIEILWHSEREICPANENFRVLNK